MSKQIQTSGNLFCDTTNTVISAVDTNVAAEIAPELGRHLLKQLGCAVSVTNSGRSLLAAFGWTLHHVDFFRHRREALWRAHLLNCDAPTLPYPFDTAPLYFQDVLLSLQNFPTPSILSGPGTVYFALGDVLFYFKDVKTNEVKARPFVFLSQLSRLLTRPSPTFVIALLLFPLSSYHVSQKQAVPGL